MFQKFKLFMRRLIFLATAKFFIKPVTVSSLNFQDASVNFNSAVLEFNEPEFQEINPTYVLIRSLKINSEIKLKTLQKFENIVKWKFLNLQINIIFRNYPLNLFSTVKQFAKDKIVLKIFNKVKSFDKKQINIAKKIKITEEIIQILPYTKSLKRQKLFKLPIARSPLYKSYFSTNQMKKFREEIAEQNKTRWSNIEIIEIYDKFNVKLFSDLKQTSTSKNLFCYPNFSNADLTITDDFYYLIIGKKRDTNELVKSLSKPITARDDFNNG